MLQHGLGFLLRYKVLCAQLLNRVLQEIEALLLREILGLGVAEDRGVLVLLENVSNDLLEAAAVWLHLGAWLVGRGFTNHYEMSWTAE